VGWVAGIAWIVFLRSTEKGVRLGRLAGRCDEGKRQVWREDAERGGVENRPTDERTSERANEKKAG
jgi:hypothetical protein